MINFHIYTLQDTPISTDKRCPSGSYADQTYFTCPEGHGVFLPVE